MISSMFRACTGSDKKVDNNSDKTIPPTQAATTQPATQAANAAALNFVTPNIQDDNTTGYMGTNAYIWNGAAYELFGGDEYRAQLYADSINSYQQKLSGIKVYNMVVPNHTEMGLPQRLKNSSAPSDSQAENIKQIYSKLNSSVTPINAYNKIAEHCNEYVYYNSDHHWTGLGAYKIGKYMFDTQKQLLTIGQKQTKLTTKENELLSLLCSHANEILKRNDALRTIWIDDNYFNARSMDVYITKLRKHLKDDDQVEIINIHGQGYKLIIPDED